MLFKLFIVLLLTPLAYTSFEDPLIFVYGGSALLLFASGVYAIQYRNKYEILT